MTTSGSDSFAACADFDRNDRDGPDKPASAREAAIATVACAGGATTAGCAEPMSVDSTIPALAVAEQSDAGKDALMIPKAFDDRDKKIFESTARVPATLQHLALVVKKHVDTYKADFCPEIDHPPIAFRLKPIRNDYMHKGQHCDQHGLYASITALLILYHEDVFRRTVCNAKYTIERHSDIYKQFLVSNVYHRFHHETCLSFIEFAHENRVSVGHLFTLLNAGLYADKHFAGHGHAKHVQRAEQLLQRLGVFLLQSEGSAGAASTPNKSCGSRLQIKR